MKIEICIFQSTFIYLYCRIIKEIIMSETSRLEQTAGDLRDKPKETLIVLTNQGSEDAKAGDWVKIFRRAESVQFYDPKKLPLQPPAGVTEVFLSSGSDVKFLNKQHQEDWSGVQFTQLVHSRDGQNVGISNETPTKQALDFEVFGGE